MTLTDEEITIVRRYEYKSETEQKKHEIDMENDGWELCGYGRSSKDTICSMYEKQTSRSMREEEKTT